MRRRPSPKSRSTRLSRARGSAALGVRALRAAGHDVAAIAAEDESGLPDRAVLERAVSEQRILLTSDRDFGALIYRSRFPASPGLILLRFVPLTSEEPAQLLLPLTGRPEIVFEGRLSVLDRERVRQRPLPRV